MYRKLFLCFALVLLISGCSNAATGPVALPNGRFLTIAHRGASAYRPEHSIPAYLLADEMGADYIELDLQMTKDRQLVVVHDSRLDRLAGIPDRVQDLTLDELKRIPYGGQFNEENPGLADQGYTGISFSGLTDVLSRFGSTVNYYIELKSPGNSGQMEEAVVSDLISFGIIGDDSTGTDAEGLPKVILQSFSERSLLRLHELRPDIPLIQLYPFKGNADLSSAAIRKLSGYASGVGIPASSAHPAFIDKLHGQGLDVHVFTVNDEDEIRGFIDMGTDGIFTDRPDLAVRLSQGN
ncbi:glycerophosphodiester phosphodiesterase family protein [Edaphobacillus lindanitolerans]|uniref:Glycerophosphoryl diester phosphodiesterase n=1 Tax=Edaphobacillus lindanitolerans TaxID=550447 RepID=A0A1U7PI29_9BACI|nr:glycerophosphodiester phosphodiesterase family protein [Edaphobacillus lindanitolerans]SIT71308.1 glycerophosphoryl diester phosphodiesterase [Edaphobacillus lindanitolerans]